jgi:hypothetical protein
VIVGNPTTESA